MAGPINSTGNTAVSNSVEIQKQHSTVRPSPTTESASNAPAATSDRVVLTDTAQRLRDLEKQLAEQPVVNDEKVNRLRNAILDGSYKVDPVRVAEKMINFEKQIKETLG